MKKLLVATILALTFVSCQQDKVEIIPNYNSEYVEVPDYVRFNQNLILPETKEIMNKDVNDIFSKVTSKPEGERNLLYYELFIGINGDVEKIEIPQNVEKSLNDKLIKKAQEWKFGKYITDGNQKKYRTSLTIMHVTYPNGKTSAMIVGNEGDVIDEKVFFVAVDEMPSPIGGIKAIMNNIVYPEKAKIAGIEGRVYVKAYIDSTGTVAKTEIIRGIGAGCDEAALKAVKKIKFTPGRQRGKAVNVQVTVPILFKLQ